MEVSAAAPGPGTGPWLRRCAEDALGRLAERERSARSGEEAARRATGAPPFPGERDVAAAEAALDVARAETARLASVAREDAARAATLLAATEADPSLAALSATVAARAAEASRVARREAEFREEAARGLAAFDADPVFAYLARRGAGTGAARGNLLTRWLDRLLADASGHAAEARKREVLAAMPAYLGRRSAEAAASLATAGSARDALAARLSEGTGQRAAAEASARSSALMEAARGRAEAAEARLAGLLDARLAHAASQAPADARAGRELRSHARDLDGAVRVRVALGGILSGWDARGLLEEDARHAGGDALHATMREVAEGRTPPGSLATAVEPVPDGRG